MNPDPLYTYAVLPGIKFLVLLLAGVMPLITYLVLVERKLLGFMQARVGPNRVGPWGLLQPIADIMKLLVKEDVTPERAYPWAHRLAPLLVVLPAFVIFALIPFGPPAGEGRRLDLFITDVDVALVFLLGLATLSVYGIVLGGWASNSKFSLMGGLRSAAQLVSYEVPQGFALVGPVLLAGSLSLTRIVEAQREAGVWYVFPQLLAFFVFFVAGIAESNRSPFDLPEAESELVAGFHTEYSGMRFALFFLGEYANMIVVSCVAVTLFLGGWLRPFPNVEALGFLDLAFLPAGLAGVIWFSLKVFVLLFFYIWFRGTFPRYRFDQLMALGWKWLLPLALVNLMATAAVKVLT
ncbi:MAG: NADH-quinone oxidoreductase subunit NuoH [Thermoanaerobaculia bacterium]